MDNKKFSVNRFSRALDLLDKQPIAKKTLVEIVVSSKEEKEHIEKIIKEQSKP